MSRSNTNENKRLSELATDLVGRRVAVIATPGSPTAAVAAKSATATIPIVFGIGSDPGQNGLLPRPNPPRRKITRVRTLNEELGPRADAGGPALCRPSQSERSVY